MEENKVMCKDCIYYDKNTYSKHGICCRFPPHPYSPMLTDIAGRKYPETNESDWCGEFKRRKA